MTFDSGVLSLLDSTVDEVFSLMLGCACQIGQRGNTDGEAFFAVVAFSGGLTGEFWLQLQVSSARAIAESMFGVATDSMAEDAAGELCNMIAGSWKSKLPRSGAACRLSPPITSRGSRSSPPQRFQQMLERNYSFEQGCFGIELSLDTSKCA